MENSIPIRADFHECFGFSISCTSADICLPIARFLTYMYLPSPHSSTGEQLSDQNASTITSSGNTPADNTADFYMLTIQIKAEIISMA